MVKDLTADKIACEKNLKQVQDQVKIALLGNNAREQYARNFCVRIFGLPVDKKAINEFGIDGACLEACYRRIVKPVLEKCLPKFMNKVPEIGELLGNAHFVGKHTVSRDNPSLTLPRPIILRFQSKFLRNLFLKNKRRFMPRPTKEELDAGIKWFSASPDLTRLNLTCLKSLSSDDRVNKVWSIDGSIRFTLSPDHQSTRHCDPSVTHFVKCVTDNPDSIIEFAINMDKAGNTNAPPNRSYSDAVQREFVNRKENGANARAQGRRSSSSPRHGAQPSSGGRHRAAVAVRDGSPIDSSTGGPQQSGARPKDIQSRRPAHIEYFDTTQRPASCNNRGIMANLNGLDLSDLPTDCEN